VVPSRNGTVGVVGTVSVETFGPDRVLTAPAARPTPITAQMVTTVHMP
jgi:hypothetical protein